MKERIALEKPKGLNEIGAEIDSLIQCSDRIESGKIKAPEGVLPLIKNRVVDLVKERLRLEAQLDPQFKENPRGWSKIKT